MKNAALIIVHCAIAIVLFGVACAGNTQSKLKGNWHSKQGSVLKITDNEFMADNSSPAEDYVLKGDTIYTSFQGNQPYTRFVIEHLDDHQLRLQYPDSTKVEFAR
jgi:hypothetical protein